jgi:hypothetical protein
MFLGLEFSKFEYFFALSRKKLVIPPYQVLCSLYDPSKTMHEIKIFENIQIEFKKCQYFLSKNPRPNYRI